jgi:solute carrier family 41
MAYFLEGPRAVYPRSYPPQLERQHRNELGGSILDFRTFNSSWSLEFSWLKRAQANIGELDIRLTRRTLIIGNLALLQVQALLVSLLAGLIAFILGLASRVAPPLSAIPDPFSEDRGTYFECVLVLAASMIAASVSSALVGSFMTALVVLSRKFKINPDNIATPLAASLGDLVSLALLGIVSSALGKYEGGMLTTVIFIGLLACIAFNVWLTLRNAYVQELLWSGWVPLLVAMLISRCALFG